MSGWFEGLKLPQGWTKDIDDGGYGGIYSKDGRKMIEFDLPSGEMQVGGMSRGYWRSLCVTDELQKIVDSLAEDEDRGLISEDTWKGICQRAKNACQEVKKKVLLAEEFLDDHERSYETLRTVSAVLADRDVSEDAVADLLLRASLDHISLRNGEFSSWLQEQVAARDASKIPDGDLKVGPFRVHLVWPGESYGRNGCLEYEQAVADRFNSGGPIIEFYDMSQNPETFPEGQFVSSYYSEDFLDHEKGTGLLLDGGISSWSISSGEYESVRSWMQDQISKRDVSERSIAVPSLKEIGRQAREASDVLSKGLDQQPHIRAKDSR